MKEKILIIGQLPPPYHGSNIMAKTMFAALESEGYEVNFVDKSFAKSIDEIGKPSLRKILRVPVLAIEILITCLFRRLALCIYFVAVGKSAFLIDTFLLFLLRLCRVPYILRFGGKGYRDLRQQSFFWHSLVSFAFTNALGGIVKGEALKSDVDFFIPHERLHLVPNAVETKPVKHGKKDTKIIQVLFLSNLHPSKGPLELLMAAKIVLNGRTNVRFVLAGAQASPQFSRKLKSYIIDNELEHYITMPGGVHGKAKQRLFASSDIFVFPTYYEYETFGIVNIEAMQQGLPVISSTEGAIPEVVQDGITGFIVNPKSPGEIANKILTLINDPVLRVNMGKKGREIIESKYSLGSYAKTLNHTVKCFLDRR